jgi:putative PIN family toxin of toxin-antitoxin system
MIKVVLDTNVLISALIRTGKPRTLITEMVKDGTQLILSRGILDEFAETVTDQKIRQYVGEEEVIRFLRVIIGIAKVVKVKSRFKVIKQNPSGDMILRTAYDGKADYIVSGDEHLLSLKEFRGIKIITIKEMLDLLKLRQK